MISIWFFIGFALLVNGGLIMAAGIYQLISPPEIPNIVLFSVHANVWWGALLFVVGLFYCIFFRPQKHPEV